VEAVRRICRVGGRRIEESRREKKRGSKDHTHGSLRKVKHHNRCDMTGASRSVGANRVNPSVQILRSSNANGVATSRAFQPSSCTPYRRTKVDLRENLRAMRLSQHVRYVRQREKNLANTKYSSIIIQEVRRSRKRRYKKI
jgi:hypothetical protein